MSSKAHGANGWFSLRWGCVLLRVPCFFVLLFFLGGKQSKGANEPTELSNWISIANFGRTKSCTCWDG